MVYDHAMKVTNKWLVITPSLITALATLHGFDSPYTLHEQGIVYAALKAYDGTEEPIIHEPRDCCITDAKNE